MGAITLREKTIGERYREKVIRYNNRLQYKRKYLIWITNQNKNILFKTTEYRYPNKN